MVSAKSVQIKMMVMSKAREVRAQGENEWTSYWAVRAAVACQREADGDQASRGKTWVFCAAHRLGGGEWKLVRMTRETECVADRSGSRTGTTVYQGRRLEVKQEAGVVRR